MKKGFTLKFWAAYYDFWRIGLNKHFENLIKYEYNYGEHKFKYLKKFLISKI